MIDLTQHFAPDVAYRLALHKKAEIDFQRLLDRDDAELPDRQPPTPRAYVKTKTPFINYLKAFKIRQYLP